MVFCFCTVKAQNPTKIVAGSGISISPSSGLGVVTITATGGGGGGSGTVTNVVSTFDILTTSGVGTPVITISKVPALVWTNSPGFVVPANFDTVNRFLISGSSPGITNDYGNGLLYSSSGDLAVNYNGRILARTGGITIMDFQNSQINDISGVVSVLASTRNLRNSSANTVLDWQNNLLKSASTATSLDWENRLLENTSSVPTLRWAAQQMENTWTNRGSFVILTNLTVNGTTTYNGATTFNGFTTFAGVTLFQATETNTAPALLIGNYNEFGNAFVTTNRFLGSVMLYNTNAYSATTHFGNFVTPDNARTYFNFNVGAAATAVGIDVGDFYNTGGLGQRYGRLEYSQSQNAIQLHAITATTLFIGANNQNQLTFDSGGALVTFGVNSSSSETHNGSTFTYANNANFNSGMFILPVSGTGTITNSTAIFTPSLLTSNITMFAPANLTSTQTTPTGVTNFIITVNGAAGTLQTQARTITMTNTFTLPFALGTVFTNSSNQRMWVTARIVFPTGTTTVSGSALATIAGGITNFQGEYQTCAGVAGQVTNSIRGWIDPGDLYWGTNFQTGAGTPTAIQNGYVQKLF